MAVSGMRALLLWCRQETEHYSDVNVYNMTTSWRDGLAFCAIIHRYRPDLIEFDRLSKENIAENNELAFSIAERYLDIPSLLDAMHMVENVVPDKLSVVTYVSQLYHCFKDKTPANQGYSTKMKPLPTRARSDSAAGSKVGKRTSPSALSGTAKRMATALRNVFRSDAKDQEHTPKNREHNGSVKQNRKIDDGTVNFIKTISTAGNTCSTCHTKVFLMERLTAEKKLFHRSCFKCRKCGTSLRPGTYQYFSDADIFCCLFDCTIVPEQKPEKPLVIKLRPICDVAAELEDENDGLSPETPTSSKSATENDSKAGSSPKQFAVVKRNTIKLNSLPQNVEKFRSRGPVRRGSHGSSKSSSGKAGERKRSLSVGSKYKSKKSHDSRRKFSVGSAKGASPRGSYYGREERSSKKDSPGRHKNDIDSTVLGTALKMALMEGAKKSVRSKGSDAGTAESEEARVKGQLSDAKGQRSDVKDSLNVTAEKPPETPSEVKPSAESVSEKGLRKVVVKELWMETLKEELTPRTSRCFSREFSSDDLSLASVDGAMDSFKDELLKRADPKGNIDNQDSDSTAVLVEPLEDQNGRQKESTEKDLVREENDKRLNEHCPSSSKEWENKDVTEDGADVADEGGKRTESNSETEKSQNSQEEEKPALKSTNSNRKAKNVQSLRNKFMNIDEMIDARHKSNLARYNLQKRKELQSVTSWTQQTSSMPNPRKKLVNTSEASKRELGGCRRSIKQLTAMYMNEIEKDKKKGKGRKVSGDFQRGRTPSDASSTGTERAESASGFESWSRRTSVSSRGGSALEEERSTEESDKAPELVDGVEEDPSEGTFKGDSVERQSALKDGEESGETPKEEACDKEQTNITQVDVSERTENCGLSENGTSIKETQSSCDSENGVFISIGAECSEETICTKRDKDSEEDGRNEVVGETSQQLHAESILEKDLNSTGQVLSSRNSNLAASSVSPLPEFKIQSPKPVPTSAILPKPGAQCIETAPVLGKELTLEIAFPNGAAPSLQRNAASHDSGIDMPSCSTAQTPGSLETGSAGEEVSVVLPIQTSRAPFALGREARMSENKNDMPVLTEPCSSAPLSSDTDALPCESCSLNHRPGSLASVEDSSSSSTPRMSIIIAQERSSTKINSRYFSLETSDPKLLSEYRITEERCPDEVMDVEGEFRFGQERIHVTRAEKGAVIAIYKEETSQNGRRNYNKEDEISLHPGKITDEIQALANVRSDLENRGVEIEKALRERIDFDNLPESDEDLLREWLSLVQRRNTILRQEAELTYLIQSHTYEQRYRAVENELRHLVAMRDDVKSSDDMKRERELLSELLELVHKRNFIVDHLEEDRIRERNEKLQVAMSDGIADSWDQSPEYTKVRRQKARTRGLKHKSRVKRHKSLGTSRESLISGQKSRVMRQRPQLMCYKSKVEG